MSDFLYKISDDRFYSLSEIAVLTGIVLSTWQYWTRMRVISFIRRGVRGKKYIIGSKVKTFLKGIEVKTIP
ncbi:MAG: hypothetical protein IIB94_12570 [Candidatus Marinimicrobia bacterium]|nr:hypothetical protein [Candidatus Neomarinimicrobiota bacterium]